ncbi:MAG: PQQ-dependent sugar dehydrogenase [Planctomycetota bacterium]|nr:PQQ-dependent sugar dehydrogenase [Planctomycetota bacterium]
MPVTLTILALLMTTSCNAADGIPPGPEGFVGRELLGSWSQPVGSLAVLDDTTLVWEKGGQIWLVDGSGIAASQPLLDISPEVGNWRDHGLLGLVVHPDFVNNGWIYLYYVVDRHHLLYHGTPSYSAHQNLYFDATICRLTRYTVEFDSQGLIDRIDHGSRAVLLGDSIADGVPVLGESHTGGGMAFGQDGTLLITTGDTAKISGVDTGGPDPSLYVTKALAEGIIEPHEDVGALRSQLVDSLCGKLLRLDATSGDGLASNPFYDPESPRSPRSRVWSLGLRNPFRIYRVPESGSHNPDLAAPGTIVVADVGAASTEELTFVDEPGQNLGWPFYEGMIFKSDYAEVDLVNPMTVNPLGDGETCSSGFPFRDLIQQDSLQTDRIFLNHCAVQQAEDQNHSGWQFDTAHFGFLGSGALAPSGSGPLNIQFQLQGNATDQTRFHLRYAHNGLLPSIFGITIDGVPGEHTLVLPPTGAATEWRTASVLLPLGKGSHTIGLTHPGNLTEVYIDCAFASDPDSTSLPVIPDSVPTFTHRRPRIDYNHLPEVDPQIATYDSFGAAATPVLGTSTSGVQGPDFVGRCVIAGPMMGYREAGSSDGSELGRNPWPEAWRGLYFGDYGPGWVMCATLNEDGSFRKLEKWVHWGLRRVVSLSTDASSSQLDVVIVEGHVYRYTWEPEFSLPPEISLVSSQLFGPAPHSVTFDASLTVDPEGSDVLYSWDFGDGSPPASGSLVTHVFDSANPGPESYTVTLTATDLAGDSSTRQLLVSVNNTPPEIEITSPLDGSYYSMTEPELFSLQSSTLDAEHGPDEITCSWQARLHHNDHFHNEAPILECQSEALVTPIGCGDEVYWYAFEFTATDAHGLSASSIVMIYPDCSSQGVCVADLDGDGVVGPKDLGILLGAWGTSVVDLDGDQVVSGSDLGLLIGEWGADCS